MPDPTRRQPASSDPGVTRQPIFWVGAAILVAALVACVVTIVLAARHADTPVETTGVRVMKVPLSR